MKCYYALLFFCSNILSSEASCIVGRSLDRSLLPGTIYVNQVTDLGEINHIKQKFHRYMTELYDWHARSSYVIKNDIEKKEPVWLVSNTIIMTKPLRNMIQLKGKKNAVLEYNVQTGSFSFSHKMSLQDFDQPLLKDFINHHMMNVQQGFFTY